MHDRIEKKRSRAEGRLVDVLNRRECISLRRAFDFFVYPPAVRSSYAVFYGQFAPLLRFEIIFFMRIAGKYNSAFPAFGEVGDFIDDFLRGGICQSALDKIVLHVDDNENLIHNAYFSIPQGYALCESFLSA